MSEPQPRGQPGKPGFPPLKIHRIGSPTAAPETRATKKPKSAARLQPIPAAPSMQLGLGSGWSPRPHLSSPPGDGLWRLLHHPGLHYSPLQSFFSPYFITEETFLKIPMLTSKPGSLGNKGGRDGSRRSVPILRISNVALYIFVFIFFIKDIPRCKAEQESLQSIYWDIISHLQQTQQLSMPRE